MLIKAKVHNVNKKKILVLYTENARYLRGPSAKLPKFFIIKLGALKAGRLIQNAIPQLFRSYNFFQLCLKKNKDFEIYF